MDKFKGTLTAAEACRAVGAALEAHGLAWESFPMADGGEGTAAVLAGRVAGWACVESSVFRPDAGSPLRRRTSRCIGEALLRSMATQPTFLAIGGTSVADCGAGLLQAFGYRFNDPRGQVIANATPEEIAMNAHSMEPPACRPWEGRLEGLADVAASLTGPGLSALDFLAQKGGHEADRKVICRAMERMVEISGAAPGAHAGAGGGLGYALESILKVPCHGGGPWIAGKILPRGGVDLFITGEGCTDAQTGGGKVAAAVAAHARALGCPCLVFSGTVAPGGEAPGVYAATPWGEPLPIDPARALAAAVGAHIAEIKSLIR